MALGKAKKAGTKEVQNRSELEALEYAAEQARDAIANNRPFGNVDAQAQAQIAGYNAHSNIGMRARVLIATVPRGESSFLAFMANEVTAHGATPTTANIPSPKNMPPGSPTTQVMRRWEYTDGTVVRYKPLGDDHRPNTPAFSIEVKKVSSVSDAAGGADGIAFKVDDHGHAAPKKYDGELLNPFTNEKQKKAFNNSAMEEVHHELTRP